MPGTENLMAGYSNSIGGLMAGHNSMVSGLMANYNAGGGSGGGFMAGPAFTPGPGVSYGPGPMNSGGSGGGMPGMFGMESDDPETQRKLLIKRRLKMGKMDGKTPGMPDLPLATASKCPTWADSCSSSRCSRWGRNLNKVVMHRLSLHVAKFADTPTLLHVPPKCRLAVPLRTVALLRLARFHSSENAGRNSSCPPAPQRWCRCDPIQGTLH